MANRCAKQSLMFVRYKIVRGGTAVDETGLKFDINNFESMVGSTRWYRGTTQLSTIF